MTSPPVSPDEKSISELGLNSHTVEAIIALFHAFQIASGFVGN